MKAELERDRTKELRRRASGRSRSSSTMTRQNVAHGPARRSSPRSGVPTCARGDGIVTARRRRPQARGERKLRALAAESRTRLRFRVEPNAHVAATPIGAGAARLTAIEKKEKRHLEIERVAGALRTARARSRLAKLKLERTPGARPGGRGEGSSSSRVAGPPYRRAWPRTGDFTISSWGRAAGMVGKRVKVRINASPNWTRLLALRTGARLEGVAVVASPPPRPQAEKPTRARRSRAAKKR